jgi:aspartyl/asparaginyl beta-hydroxylase (cupin superfamily)
MTPEIEAAFAAIRQEYGDRSIDRVEAMLDPAQQNRHPLQHRARWIMPGLSHKPWHDPYEHPEVKPVALAFEEAHADIQAELHAAWERRRAEFSDYHHYLGPQTDWQALYLYRNGRTIDESAELLPTTARVLRETAIETDTICPVLESFISTLLPGARTKLHCDLWNFSINLHFAIDIPDDCAITVAGETRTWQEGKAMLFDYSFEHEAWNDNTSRPRTVLITDLWHPETTIPERKALVALVTEIRALTGE